MRILLCDPATGMFFQSPNGWTEQRDLAENFGSSPRAILFARERALRGVEVYWDFDDPEYNVRLPVRLDESESMREAA